MHGGFDLPLALRRLLMINVGRQDNKIRHRITLLAQTQESRTFVPGDFLRVAAGARAGDNIIITLPRDISEKISPLLIIVVDQPAHLLLSRSGAIPGGKNEPAVVKRLLEVFLAEKGQVELSDLRFAEKSPFSSVKLENRGRKPVGRRARSSSRRSFMLVRWPAGWIIPADEEPLDGSKILDDHPLGHRRFSIIGDSESQNSSPMQTR